MCMIRMMKKNLKIESKSFVGDDKNNTSVHDMFSIIHGMLTPEHVTLLPQKSVPLKNALLRVVAEEIRAQYDSPLFDESLRDGFAIAGDVDVVRDETITFELVGETGAGDSLDKSLEKNETWKVMTGGVIPGNCARVIPQEWCNVNGSTVTIATRRLSGSRFIKKRGSEFKKAELLADVGEVITPVSIVRIADCGWSDVIVYRQPRCCFCCTGKELVGGGRIPGSAQKISSNQYLLSALLEKLGCKVHDYGIVNDDAQSVKDFFQFSLQGNFDLVLTTGGTGGGAFDLVESGFADAGGTLICNSIDMRPGKSLVVGEKDGTLYVGLPGPPHAVHTVFLEIIAPLLSAMKGAQEDSSHRIVAIASEDIVTKTRGSILIKEGLLTFKDGFCHVRKTGKNEHGNCNILIAPGRDEIRSGQKVEVHLWGLSET